MASVCSLLGIVLFLTLRTQHGLHVGQDDTAMYYRAEALVRDTWGLQVK